MPFYLHKISQQKFWVRKIIPFQKVCIIWLPLTPAYKTDVVGHFHLPPSTQKLKCSMYFWWILNLIFFGDLMVLIKALLQYPKYSNFQPDPVPLSSVVKCHYFATPPPLVLWFMLYMDGPYIQITIIGCFSSILLSFKIK